MGRGKSVLLKSFVKKLKSNNIHHVVVAPTGMAAENVNGRTYFSGQIRD